jgi:hypothetical protein
MHGCALGEACKKHTYTGEHMRRSLTVTPENDKKILLTKGLFLTGDEPFDIDYTTLVNIFIELGHKVMSSALSNDPNPNIIMNKNEIFEVFKKHAFSSELKEESVGDQFAEIIIRKLIEQFNKTSKESIRQTNNTALPPQNNSSKETEKEKYIS